MAALTGGRHAPVLEMLEEAKFGLLGADARLNRITALARRLAAAGAPEDRQRGLRRGRAARGERGGGWRRRRAVSAKFYEPAFRVRPWRRQDRQVGAEGPGRVRAVRLAVLHAPAAEDHGPDPAGVPGDR